MTYEQHTQGRSSALAPGARSTSGELKLDRISSSEPRTLCCSSLIAHRASLILGVIVILAATQLACGYHAANSATTTAAALPVYVPALITYAAEPELSVWGSAYFARRIERLGVPTTSNDTAEVHLQGVVLDVTEAPVGALDGAMLVELVLLLRAEIHTVQGLCETRVIEARAALTVTPDVVVGPARQSALESALADAVDRLALDIYGCLEGW